MKYLEFAWNYVLDHEDSLRAGTITYDSGGETRFGIAQRWHPQEYPALAQMSVADALVRAGQIFAQEYWQLAFEQIGDIRVAAKLVDIDFNLGAVVGKPKGMGVLIAQMACDDLGQKVPETAFFGPLTLAAINSLNPDRMLLKMCMEEEIHIRNEYAVKGEAAPRGLIVRAQDRPRVGVATQAT